MPTTSITQTQTHMPFLQCSQIYATAFSSSKNMSSFNSMCLHINGLRSTPFKIPNKHYSMWVHNILFIYSFISIFFKFFQEVLFDFVGFWFVWGTFGYNCCHLYHTLNSPCSFFCLLLSSTRPVFADIVTKLYLKDCIFIIYS